MTAKDPYSGRNLLFDRFWGVPDGFDLSERGLIQISPVVAKKYLVSNEALHGDILLDFLNVRDWISCRTFLERWGAPLEYSPAPGTPSWLPLSDVLSSAEALRFARDLLIALRAQDCAVLSKMIAVWPWFDDEVLSAPEDVPKPDITFKAGRRNYKRLLSGSLKCKELFVSFEPVSPSALWQGAVGFSHDALFDPDYPPDLWRPGNRLRNPRVEVTTAMFSQGDEALINVTTEYLRAIIAGYVFDFRFSVEIVHDGFPPRLRPGVQVPDPWSAIKLQFYKNATASDPMEKCPRCGDAYVKKKSNAESCGKAACRRWVSRRKAKDRGGRSDGSLQKR